MPRAHRLSSAVPTSALVAGAPFQHDPEHHVLLHTSTGATAELFGRPSPLLIDPRIVVLHLEGEAGDLRPGKCAADLLSFSLVSLHAAQRRVHTAPHRPTHCNPPPMSPPPARQIPLRRAYGGRAYFVEPPQLVLRSLHERRLVEPALFGAATSDVPSTADAAAAAAASASR